MAVNLYSYIEEHLRFVLWVFPVLGPDHHMRSVLEGRISTLRYSGKETGFDAVGQFGDLGVLLVGLGCFSSRYSLSVDDIEHPEDFLYNSRPIDAVVWVFAFPWQAFNNEMDAGVGYFLHAIHRCRHFQQ